MYRMRTKKHKPGLIPQERDWQAIVAVYNCDVLTKLQIEDWIFRQGDPSIKHTRCKERLPLLVSNNYLWEGWSPSIDGKKPVKVYRLGPQARNELAGRLKLKPNELKWEPKERYEEKNKVREKLKLNDIRIAFDLSAVHSQLGLEIGEWIYETELRQAHAKHPFTFTDQDGQVKKGYVVGDSFVRIYKRGKKVSLRFFIEEDNNTEPLEVWFEKIKKWLAFIHKVYPELYQAKRPRVLTVTTDEKRLSALQQCTEAAGGKNVFRFTTFERFRNDRRVILTEPLWNVAGLPASKRTPLIF